MSVGYLRRDPPRAGNCSAWLRKQILSSFVPGIEQVRVTYTSLFIEVSEEDVSSLWPADRVQFTIKQHAVTPLKEHLGI